MTVNSNTAPTGPPDLYEHLTVRKTYWFCNACWQWGCWQNNCTQVLALTNQGDTTSRGAEVIHKTNNMEYEFITTISRLGVRIILSLCSSWFRLDRSRQKELQSGRSFEEVIDIFRPTIHRLDVVLFTYDMISMESFHDLVYWIDGVGDLLNDASHFILLGTHLDRGDERSTKEDIEEGMEYLAKEMRAMRPCWRGNFAIWKYPI